MKRYTIARRVLIFWCLFIGIGAVGGCIMMLFMPDEMGMTALLPYFQVLPFANVLFQNLVFSAFALLVVNGLTNLLAAVLLLRRKKMGIVLGGVFGVTLMLWITIQFIIFPANFMSTAYFIFGACQAITGYACYVFYRQTITELSAADFPHAGTREDTLVVYFSRLGRVRRVAWEAAERCGGRLFELTTPERTEGTLGFWWCGRFAMHGWAMPVRAMPEELSRYDRVIIVAPVWAFGLAGPVRAFCQQAKGQIARASYVLVHFQGFKYQYIADDMDKMLGLRRERFASVSSALGRYRLIADEGAAQTQSAAL